MALNLNFARKPFRDSRPISVTLISATVLGAVLFALNVRDALHFRDSAAGTRAEILRLNEQAAAGEESAARTRSLISTSGLKELQTEGGALNSIVRERQFSWILLLSRLERVLPGEVYLTSLAPAVGPDGSATLTLSLVGKSEESIVKTLDAFAKDAHFRRPVPSSETDPEKGQPEGFQFHLTVRYFPQEPS
ncbi:MAG: PilN domain-containing protein [Thermoanaerobaculia bacterium]